MSRQFELNKALFEAVTACFDYHIDLSTCTIFEWSAECHIDDPRPQSKKKIVWTLSI